MIALVVGYALVTLFSLMGNLSYLSILHLILFQGIFALIGTLIPKPQKILRHKKGTEENLRFLFFKRLRLFTGEVPAQGNLLCA